MMRVEAAIEIEAPPEAVWALVADARRYPEYVDFVREVVDVSHTPLQAGSTYRERAKPGPREGLYDWTVVECDEGRRMVHVSYSGEMDARLTCIIEPLGTGRTHYRQTMEFRMLPAFRPLGWVVERAFVRRKMASDFTRFLGTIKRIVEAEHRSGAPREAGSSERAR